MEGTEIILVSAAGLLVLAIFLIYRIMNLKKEKSDLASLSRNIGEMERERRNDPSTRGPVIDVPEIPPGQVLVVLHRKSGRSWKKAVNDRLSRGAKGVVVTMNSPASLERTYRGDVEYIWLDRSTAHDVGAKTVVINPTNLSGVLKEMERRIEKEGIAVIPDLEGILGANESSRVMRFLKMLDNSCSAGNYSVLVPASYRAIPQRTRVRLTESFDTVVI